MSNEMHKNRHAKDKSTINYYGPTSVSEFDALSLLNDNNDNNDDAKQLIMITALVVTKGIAIEIKTNAK